VVCADSTTAAAVDSEAVITVSGRSLGRREARI